jgi:hypothetical protein
MDNHERALEIAKNYDEEWVCPPNRLETISYECMAEEREQFKSERLSELAEAYLDLTAHNEALEVAADGMAEALDVYLMAGHKEARRHASVVSKERLTAYRKLKESK